MNKFKKIAVKANQKIGVDTVQLEPTYDFDGTIVKVKKDKRG